jgi:peptidoglycan glycosyltransferase
MNTPLRRVGLAMLAMLVLLLGNVTYIQMVNADDYRADARNQRVLFDEYSRERGKIISNDGKQLLATVTPTNDRLKFQRQYPLGPAFAPVTGFYSVRYGARALERSEDEILNGSDDRLFVRRLSDLITGRDPRGGNVQTTIDSRVQQAAYDAMVNPGTGQSYTGAVVALRPQTGEILAMVSTPSYDPNPLSSHNSEGIQKTWNRLLKDPDKPLENRAVTTLYPPGSTFKIVTAAAALSSGKYTPDTEIPGPPFIRLPKSTATLPNLDGKTCDDGTPTLRVALEQSCNTVFARIGMDLGDDALRQQAEGFGFNSSHKVPLLASESGFPSDMDGAQTAQSSIGQFSVTSTVLQDAMVAAGVANDGKVMKPYLIEEVRSPDFSVLEESKPEVYREAVSQDVAQQLTEMLVSVVDRGTGENAKIDNVSVAGKTGTAQHRKGAKPHAWFTAFAPAEDPQVAVAVVIEDGAENRSEISGGRLAAPIAKAVMEAVLNK